MASWQCRCPSTSTTGRPTRKEWSAACVGCSSKARPTCQVGNFSCEQSDNWDYVYLQGTWQATLMPKLFLVHIVQSLSRQRYSWTSTRADTLGRGNMNAVFVERGFLRKEKWRTTNSSTGTRGATLAITVESLLPETLTWEYTWKCTQREGKYHQNQQEGIDKVMTRISRKKELSTFLLFSGSLQVLESCLHWSPRQLWYIRTTFWWNVPLMFETRLSF